MGLRLECIKMEEQLLLLENPLLKVLLLEDEGSDCVNPNFLTKEKIVASFKLCSQCCWSKHKILFLVF